MRHNTGSRTLVCFVGLALALAAGSALAGESSAEVIHHGHLYIHRDPRHDVLQFKGNPFDGKARPEHVRGRRDGDIVRERARYGWHELHLTLTFADFTRPRGDGGAVEGFDLYGPHGRSFMITSFIDSGGLQGAIEVDNNTGNERDPIEVRCPQATSAVNYGTHIVRVVVPAHCFGKAAWLRLFTLSQVYPSHGRSDYVDSGESEGTQFLHQKVGPLSPRIYR